MSRCFEIDLEHCEGALLRLLGTVERRGFSLIELKADKPDTDSYTVSLRLASERDPQVLCRQLERLVDVRAVRLLPAPAEQSPAATFQATWL